MSKTQWELMSRGDKNAFIFIYETYYNNLFSYGFSICADKELTKDCIHDLFLEIWRNREKINKDVENIRSYLFTWLRRNIKKQTSHPGNSTQTFDNHDDSQGHESSYEDLLIRFQHSAEQRELLEHSLKRLTRKQLEVIQLKFFENLSYVEIAHRTGLTERTVYNHIYEAIQKLRACMRLVVLMLLLFIQR